MMNQQKWMASLHDETPPLTCSWTGHNSITDGCFNGTTSPWSIGGMTLGGFGGALVGGPLGMLAGITADLVGACVIGAVQAGIEYCGYEN